METKGKLCKSRLAVGGRMGWIVVVYGGTPSVREDEKKKVGNEKTFLLGRKSRKRETFLLGRFVHDVRTSDTRFFWSFFGFLALEKINKPSSGARGDEKEGSARRLSVCVLAKDANETAAGSILKRKSFSRRG